MDSEQLNEILDLRQKATRIAEQVGTRLKAGASPDQLLALLQDQAELIKQLQERLSAFKPSPEQGQEQVDRLKTDFQALIKTTEENVRLATSKGVRLTGIGGKPYVPTPQRLRTQASPTPSEDSTDGKTC